MNLTQDENTGAPVASPKSIVLRYFEEMRTLGLCEAHTRRLHPDVSWTSANGDLTMDGVLHMGSEIQKLIVGSFNIVPGTVTAEADRVAVEARSDVLMANGTRYQNTYHFLFQLKGDKIIRVHEHFDSAHANEIWGPYAALLRPQKT